MKCITWDIDAADRDGLCSWQQPEWKVWMKRRKKHKSDGLQVLTKERAIIYNFFWITDFLIDLWSCIHEHCNTIILNVYV